MAADGDAEIEATLARVQANCAGGRVFEGFVPDKELPEMPYIVMDFVGPVRSFQDRTIAHGEANQPHTLGVNAAIYAATAREARKAFKKLFNTLLDWAPTADANDFVAAGTWKGSTPRQDNTPSRAIRGGFFETQINNTIP